MFDYVSGKVAAVGENRVVIDCGGVGFAMTATASACAEFGGKEQAKVPVYLAVRDDALELFGFASETERKLFLNLISVSGVGAKLAVTLLSGLKAESLASAIARGDTAVLSGVKGVGKKTAERITLELRDKIVAAADMEAPALSGAYDENAVLALVSLGYDKKEAESAIKRFATPDMTTEQIVYAVLHG